jgi:hypothetical protein
MRMRISMVESMPADDTVIPFPEKDPAAVAMGRKGGRIGGAKRAENMSKDERIASAKQAAAARWAKVAVDREALKGADPETAELHGGRSPKPFTFTLLPVERDQIEGAVGGGGQQTLHRRLTKQLADGNLTIELDDQALGELIRYMTRYGSGGFQTRLRRAFGRNFFDLFGPILRDEYRL